MSFVVLCPGCRRQVAVDERLAGHPARCPLCAIAFEVPAPPRSAAPRPRPVLDDAEPARQRSMLLMGLFSAGIVGLVVLGVAVVVGVYALHEQSASVPPKKPQETQLAEAPPRQPIAPAADQPDKAPPRDAPAAEPQKDNPPAVEGERPFEKPAEKRKPNRPPDPAPRGDAQQPPREEARKSEPPAKTETPPKAQTPKPAAPPQPAAPAKVEPTRAEPTPSAEAPKPTAPPRAEAAKRDPPPTAETTRPAPQPRASASPLPLPRHLRADEIFPRLVKSSVFIVIREGWGSGALVHAQRRLVLTNYHVVGDNSQVYVSFPRYDKSGKLIVDGDVYLRAFKNREFLQGKVLKVAKGQDLAVVQLDKLPEDTPALKLAAKSASTGQTVYSVGNAGASDARWQFVDGTVRGVSHKNWDVKEGRKIHNFDADVVETTSQTNAGDSGGPLVNDRLQLVGVTEGANVAARGLSLFIDIGEVKKLLQGCGVDLAEVVASPDEGPDGVADAADIATLMQGLRDEDMHTRAEAARRLGALGPEARSAARALKKLLSSDDEPEVRRNAAVALGRIGPDIRSQARRDVVAALRDSDSEVRAAVLQALVNLGAPDEDELPAVLSVLRSARRRHENKACLHALKVLATFGPEAKEAVEELRALLKSMDQAVRAQALATLRKLGPAAAEAAPDLAESLRDTDGAVRLQAAFVLTAIDPKAAGAGKEALSVLVLALRPESTAESKDTQFQERIKAIHAVLVKMGEPAAERLLRAIEGEFRSVRSRSETSTLNATAREKALQIIAAIGPRANTSRMLTALVELQRSDPSRAVREAAQEAHIKIQGGN
jgi:S1-C subfamily serine protease